MPFNFQPRRLRLSEDIPPCLRQVVDGRREYSPRNLLTPAWQGHIHKSSVLIKETVKRTSPVAPSPPVFDEYAEVWTKAGPDDTSPIHSVALTLNGSYSVY